MTLTSFWSLVTRARPSSSCVFLDLVGVHISLNRSAYSPVMWRVSSHRTKAHFLFLNRRFIEINKTIYMIAESEIHKVYS